MKGGNACILAAAFRAVEMGLPLKVVFGVDEENISQGAHDLVSSGHLDDIGCMMVAEAGQVEDFSQPFSVGFGRKGRVAFEATVYGELSHAAVATPETNAINRAAAFIRLLESLSFPTHHALGSTRIVPHCVSSEASAFSAPGECFMRFSALTTPGVTGESLMSQIRHRLDSEGLRVDLKLVERPTPYGEAYEAPLDNSWVQMVLERVITPAKVTPTYFSSVADENVFAGRLGIPVITMGPIGAGDHTKDEWVRISSLDATCRAYEDTLRLWHAGTLPG
jgi:acetylornithine deacetylase/succinyl-diaminopimelate desuccinylase-like protein